MQEPKNYKITVSNMHGAELSLTISWEADIYEWIEVFKCILYWLQFNPEQIDKLHLSTQEDIAFDPFLGQEGEYTPTDLGQEGE